MRIHSLEHAPFEGPAHIAQWAARNGHSIVSTRLYETPWLPELGDLDLLLVMGGPMNIYEDVRYPWLAPEKAFIQAAIDAGKAVLGVCLGAQLVADALGAQVIKNEEREIGWYPVKLEWMARRSTLFGDFPERFPAFHWHGDTFGIPPGALHIAGNEACEHQAFEYESKVVGLQFHLEATVGSIAGLVENCREEITPDPFVQQLEEGVMRSRPEDLLAAHELLEKLLAKLARMG